MGTVEWCYKGERIQLHVQNGEVKAFGTDLQDRTELLGSDLIAPICQAVQGHNGGLIIDAVLQGVGNEKDITDKLPGVEKENDITDQSQTRVNHETLDKLVSLPQNMVEPEIAALEAKLAALKRGRREAAMNGPKNTEGPHLVAFDLLWKGTESLMGYSLKSRREHLRALFKEISPQLTLAQCKDFEEGALPDQQRINAMMREAVANGVATGLLFKSLCSPYEAGRQSGAWVRAMPTSE